MKVKTKGHFSLIDDCKEFTAWTKQVSLMKQKSVGSVPEIGVWYTIKRTKSWNE